MSKQKNRKVYTPEERKQRAIEARRYRVSRLLRWGNRTLTSLTRGEDKQLTAAITLCKGLQVVSDSFAALPAFDKDVDKLAEFCNDLIADKETTFAAIGGCVAACEIKVTRKAKPEAPKPPEPPKPQIHKPDTDKSKGGKAGAA